MSARVVVLGGGISGLAAAFELRRLAVDAGIGLEVLLLERQAEAGGKIRSERSDGFLLEGGPNGYLSSRQAAVDLVRRLELTERTVSANEASARRFVWFNGRLQAIPSSPGAMVRSRLLSLGGKLRLFAEPLIPARRYPASTAGDGRQSYGEGGGGGGEGGPPPGMEDETVAEFGRRRMGAQATARLLDPFLTGIYAGDVERTSVAAAFPRIVALEREYGGLVKGMIGRRRAAADGAADGAEAALAEAAKAGVASGGPAMAGAGDVEDAGDPATAGGGERAGPAGPGGTLTSFQGGMRELTGRLVEVLGDGVVRTGVDAVEVRVAGPRRFVVRLGGGEEIAADSVVLALPTHTSAALLAGATADGAIAAGLRALRGVAYAPVGVVGLGYRIKDLVRPPDGFGYLTPGSEGRRVLGMLWSHCIFPGVRAPEGHALMRCIVGGVRSPEVMQLGDDDLVEHVRQEVREAVGEVEGTGPVFSRVVRWNRGIPQYERGHLARVAAVDALGQEIPGLYVGGNGLRGVSLADCCSEGVRLAEAVLRGLP